MLYLSTIKKTLSRLGEDTSRNDKPGMLCDFVCFVGIEIILFGEGV